MYQDAYNTIQTLFKSGVISHLSFDENGIILALIKKTGETLPFETMMELLEFIEINEK